MSRINPGARIREIGSAWVVALALMTPVVANAQAAGSVAEQGSWTAIPSPTASQAGSSTGSDAAVEIAAANVETARQELEEQRRQLQSAPVTTPSNDILTLDDAKREGVICGLPGAAQLDAILPLATDHGSFASSVVVGRNRVLTAAHAVKGGQRFFVRVNGEYRSAELALVDREWDLAVLRVPTGNIQPLVLAASDPIADQVVWAAGFPRASALTMTEGVFQENQGGALHTSASIDSGQSGGGLLSCRDGVWRVQGMLRGFGAYRQAGGYVKLPNHSVSVSALEIQRFLALVL